MRNEKRNKTEIKYEAINKKIIDLFFLTNSTEEKEGKEIEKKR